MNELELLFYPIYLSVLINMIDYRSFTRVFVTEIVSRSLVMLVSLNLLSLNSRKVLNGLKMVS